MEVKPSYLGTMIALATAAFGLIAALAWNKFITDLIGLFLKPGTGVWAESALRHHHNDHRDHRHSEPRKTRGPKRSEDVSDSSTGVVFAAPVR